MSQMYARQEPDGSWTLRQERFRQQLEAGKEHPHDVCAVASSLEQLKEMTQKHWPDAIYPDLT